MRTNHREKICERFQSEEVVFFLACASAVILAVILIYLVFKKYHECTKRLN